MSRKGQENVVAVVLLVLFAGAIGLSLDFGPRARMIPLPLALFGFVLTLAQLVWQNAGSTDDLQMEMIDVSDPAPGGRADGRPAQGEGPPWRREVAACGMVALFLALTLLLGPMPAVFLFTGGYFVLTRQYSWRAGLLYTAAFTAAVYLLFFAALEVQPYHGLLEPVIARFH